MIPYAGVPPAGCKEAIHPKLKVNVARLHYRADPSKTPDWALNGRETATSAASWELEQEINFEAFSGALIFPEFDRDLNVCPPFAIPSTWTRYAGVDPHPRVPHAFVWVAVDPYGEMYVYRDYWPSRVYGSAGHIPEDEKLYAIDDYCHTIKFLQSGGIDVFGPNGYVDNSGVDEHIQTWVMDYTAKGWMADRSKGKDGEESFWSRYNSCHDDHGNYIGIHTQEANKDFLASRDIIGQWLRPRHYSDGAGQRQKSKLTIFDTCQEVIHEFKTCRYPKLTPEQAQVKDPIAQPLEIRKHALDCLRYVAMLDPRYVERSDQRNVAPIYEGVAY